MFNKKLFRIDTSIIGSKRKYILSLLLGRFQHNISTLISRLKILLQKRTSNAIGESQN